MEQMKADGLETIDINFEDANLPETVKTLRPLVWHDESLICVLPGPEPREGVFGCGATIEAAFGDWEAHVSASIRNLMPGDEVGIYIKDSLKAIVYKVN